MGALVTVSQAGYLVRKNERAVRWQIGKGHLTPQSGDDGFTRLDVDELATVRGWHVDAARLAELLDQEGRTVAAMADRMAALERRFARLEQMVMRAAGLSATPTTRSEAAEAADDMGARATPVGAASGLVGPYNRAGDVSRGETPRRATMTMHLSSSLPDELVSMAAFAALHGIPESTVKKAMQSGRLVARQGAWKHGRALVRWALDEEGRSAFYALWGDRDDFQRCADCPH